MPHLRKRYLLPLVQKTRKFSPIIGIFGHRQVGKTTLAAEIVDQYVTLDDSVQLDEVLKDPKAFIRNSAIHPIVIDECQLAPPLFPVLKEWVRTHPSPGQFLLTGSVRFSSRKAIRESLTGRIIAWELLPMNMGEAFNEPLSQAVIQLTQSPTVSIRLKPLKHLNAASFKQYLQQGGLPGIFAIREPSIRAQRFETQINTLMERDLQLLTETSLSYRTLRHLAEILAMQQGQPLELTSVSRQAQISVPTLRKLIAAFESMYFIRLVPTEGTEKRPVIFFEDQGEATFLTDNRYTDLAQLTRFLFAQIRHQWVYRPELGAKLFQYRTRGGAYIPLCLRIQNQVLGILPILTETPETTALGSARSFIKAYDHAKVIFVHPGKNDEVITPQLRALPLAMCI